MPHYLNFKELHLTIPNQNILINALGLKEAKDSSAIENIITTHDDLYKSELNLNSFSSLEAKEVQNYIIALKRGFFLITQKQLLTNSMKYKVLLKKTMLDLETFLAHH